MQHLDDGMIHAWLDGQLPPDEAAAVEAHVAECRQCADAVAEARGLIAASSRILTALDSVPRDVVPKPITASDALPEGVLSLRREAPPNVDVARTQPPVAPVTTARPPRRWFTAPAMAAAAAVVVAVGMFSLYQRDTVSQLAPAARVPSTTAVATDTAVAAAERIAVSAPSALGGVAGAANEARPNATPPAAPQVASARAESDQVRPVDAAKMQAFSKVKEAADSVSDAQVASRREVEDRSRLVDESRKLAQVPVATPTPASRIDSVAAAAPAGLAAQKKTEPTKPGESRADAATVGRISGRVTDANNTGIAGAMVQVAGTNTGATTNERGEYSLGGVPIGGQKLLVRRVGYQPTTRDVSVTQSQTVTADIVIAPATLSLSEVVVTGTGGATAAPRNRAQRPAAPPQQAAPVSAPSPIVAPQRDAGQQPQSTAAGCYEWTVTSTTGQQRTRFLQVPRRLALDTVVTPSSNDGIWYLARDLARTNVLPNGLWRPVEGGVEVQWVVGVKTSTVRLTGSANAVMRGNIEEIDRSAGTGESGQVISVRRACEG